MKNWRNAEKRAREKLEEKYDREFEECELRIGYRSTGEEITHRFDAVSEDEEIIGEVKDYKYGKKNYANTRFSRALLDCRYLEKVDAKRKFLILTRRKFYRKFKQNADGLIDPDIEIVLLREL